MASSKQQQAESPEDELPQDQNTDAGDLAPADPEIAKAEAATKAGVLAAMELAAMEGTTGALHAVHARLQEMKPFLTGAIEQADGKLKDFLVSLHAAF
jgi:hypothetical protein